MDITKVDTPVRARTSTVVAPQRTAISETLSQFAVTCTYDSVPEIVRERAKYLLLDAIGIAYASTSFDFAHRAHSALVSTSRSAGSKAIGMRGDFEMRDAVVMNSMLVHGLDFDDTYFAGGIHPTASCFPSALAVAADVPASGREFLRAYIVAMEVATRVSSVAQGALNQVGIHPSSLVGAFAGAIAAGCLMQLNAHQLTMAQGITLGMAGGTLQSLQDGSWTKRIQPGWAAASGVTAARLARQGFVGSVDAYEGLFGLFPTYLRGRESDCDYSLATAGLGETWNIPRVALKPYPACHATQACIEATLTLAKAHALTPPQIKSITAVVPPHYVKLVCEPLEQKRRPGSSYGAQFSVPYTIACALVRGRFGLTEIGEAAFTDPAILDLARKVDYRVDQAFSTERFKTSRPAEVLIATTDGHKYSHNVTALRGSLDRPLDSSEVVAKFMDNAAAVMTRAQADRICSAVLSIEQEPDASRFEKLLALY